MSFTKCVGFFVLYILFSMENSETKLSVAIIKLPVLNWKRYLRQNVLRDKYGEACLKVAVRKCFKALMAVRNKVCKTKFRCKSKFKSDFKEFSKSECIDEFNIRIPLKAKKKFIPRKKYLDACIPHMVPQSKRMNGHISLRSDVVRNLLERILRSSSERKCVKLSRKKCRMACNYVKDLVCKIHSCGNRKKRVLKKACKRECKKAYVVRKRYSRSSSDSD